MPSHPILSTKKIEIMAITLCTHLVTGDIVPSCSNPIYTGLEEIGYIINKSDIASYTMSGNVVSAIALASGKKAFKIYNPGKTPFTGTQKAMVEGKVSNKFTKTVSFVLPSIGPKACDTVDGLANGEFVIILASKFNGDGTADPDDCKFEIFGWHKGLKATATDNDMYSEDTDGGWAITMTEESVPMSGVYFYDSSEATSRSALEALC